MTEEKPVLHPSWLDDPGLHDVLAVLPQARPVGGCVRDALAGRPVADIDLAVPMPPEQTLYRLEQAGLHSIPTGLSHGTVTAVSRGQRFEITSLRRDLATDGRHAEVSFTDDWQEDAARRDFTINAMSLSPDGTLHDYFGGLDDLRAGRVRFVGQAARRVAEDRLRALRFFRFQARYGRWEQGAEPDVAAMQAIAAIAGELTQLSAERVWSELRRILTGPHLAATLGAMERTGVLPVLFPAGYDPAPLIEAVANGMPGEGLAEEAIPRLALLVGEKEPPRALAERLRLSGQEAGRLAACLDGSVPVWDGAADTVGLRRLLADDPAQALIDRAWVTLRDERAAHLTRLLTPLSRPHFPLAGRDLLAAGLATPGPALGHLLDTVRTEWLHRGCREGEEEKAALLAWVEDGLKAGEI
ncbi:Poly(A) polymerase [Granulibacter bethesdensis]|uniref:Poly(A) polymerase n=1 Tax=Granulibacter bethesdensis TaxID=364410 RepID=A0AAC9KAY8_9PROT|nr:CCA tRNA nucleotidyltransferase [Granulibacter bethesdensis]APH54929.1 Poly(A) polymerase [Granulibacter bethesdensis]APH62515.1 Poly(A) polymerase [Granulibacter bethesdensis]